MIQQEVKRIKEDIFKEIDMLFLDINNMERISIAMLIATKMKEVSNDSVYQHVINGLSDE